MHERANDIYKSAGVDITAGYSSVRLIKNDVERTRIPGVLGGVGGFGGLFMPDLSGYKQPVFVFGTDGVGTKLKLAFLLDKHDTVGIDAVAMCVNDIVCSGAVPLTFLDYIACGKNVPERIAAIVKGIADGCVQAGCALVGGETAEMPGFYPEDEYDIAGYACGVVDRDKIIGGTSAANGADTSASVGVGTVGATAAADGAVTDSAAAPKAGDVIIGITSSGLHSNGFSLIRKLFNINADTVPQYVPEFGKSLGEELLTPTKIYVKPLLALIGATNVKAAAHITGGGFYENIPRCLPRGLTAKIVKHSYPRPAVYRYIAENFRVDEHDLYNTFNMGIGMTVIVSPENADAAVAKLLEHGESAYCIGEVVAGDELTIF
ncbi:phosphoribosylformylglycinamidine cyclo-ligase [Clostridia bacterium]|nr:phosphoribosylformylglycinamidine cyclo-ligase [Clostridia bacterium]